MVANLEEFITSIYYFVHHGAWWPTVLQPHHLVSSRTPSPRVLWQVRVILYWLPENSSFPKIFYHRSLWDITPILILDTPQHVANSITFTHICFVCPVTCRSCQPSPSTGSRCSHSTLCSAAQPPSLTSKHAFVMNEAELDYMKMCNIKLRLQTFLIGKTVKH